MNEIMRRMEQGERSWPAEIVLRAFGLCLLAMCVAASLWLYRAVHQPPARGPRALEIGAAALVAIGWSLGCSFLVEGPGLFRLVYVPSRHGHISL